MSVFATAMTALDEATAESALDVLEQLHNDTSANDLKRAQAIVRALWDLQDLGDGKTPDYGDPWLAPLYALWHHISHTQMAYHLAQVVTKYSNPFLPDGPQSIYIYDFACGTMPMKFAAAIASSERLLSTGELIEVFIESKDGSAPMWRFGQRLWENFYHLIEAAPNDGRMAALLQSCDISTFKFGAPSTSESVNIRWLTSMHAVYEESKPMIDKYLDYKISTMQPDAVVITTHRSKRKFAFRPASSSYRSQSGLTTWKVTGKASAVDNARRKVYEMMIRRVDGIGDEDKDFARKYLVSDSLEKQANLPIDTARMVYTRSSA